MDVGKIGQGGLSSFDTTSTKAEVPQAVQQEPVIVAKNDVSSSSDKGDNRDKVNEKELKVALDKLTKFLEDDNTKVEYQYHSKFNDLMIKIVNKDTNEVILEVPPKKILDLVAKMMEMVGVFFDKKA